MPVRIETKGAIFTVILSNPDSRNAVDRPTAEALAEAFREFDSNETYSVGILTGDGGTFCSGANLKALATGDANRLEPDGDGPMGPSRFLLNKPVIAAIEGYAVAGGLELALWCDLRVAAEDAILGVFCRRFGVPLIDGGTVRLPRLIGLSRAMDLILTGRAVDAMEALGMGLVNRVTPKGKAREVAEELAEQIARFPQQCLRADRLSAYEFADHSLDDALLQEFNRGVQVVASESISGAQRFADGVGRHGKRD